jgi:hypothetical protein
MAQCSAVKPNGARCERIVGASQRYCYAHDPMRSEERKRAASRAGRSKGNQELKEIKQRLKTLAEDMLAGRVERADAIAVNQCLNTLLRALGMEHKWEAEEGELRASEEEDDTLDHLTDEELVTRLYKSAEERSETPDYYSANSGLEDLRRTSELSAVPTK